MEITFTLDGQNIGKLGMNPKNNQVAIMNADNTHSVDAYGFNISNEEDQNRQFYTSWDGFICNEDLSNELLEEKRLFAQRSYVERPQTLINTLNNCNSTQLYEIKTILGII